MAYIAEDRVTCHQAQGTCDSLSSQNLMSFIPYIPAACLSGEQISSLCDAEPEKESKSLSKQLDSTVCADRRHLGPLFCSTSDCFEELLWCAQGILPAVPPKAVLGIKPEHLGYKSHVQPTKLSSKLASTLHICTMHPCYGCS